MNASLVDSFAICIDPLFLPLYWFESLDVPSPNPSSISLTPFLNGPPSFPLSTPSVGCKLRCSFIYLCVRVLPYGSRRRSISGTLLLLLLSLSLMLNLTCTPNPSKTAAVTLLSLCISCPADVCAGGHSFQSGRFGGLPHLSRVFRECY